MKVTQRLYLTALPAVLGVISVAGLAYWGQFAHAVPEVLLIIAGFATVGTMVLSWINVRYVVARLERLAHQSAGGRPAVATADELDTIEGAVADLNTAVLSEQRAREHDQTLLALRRTEYARVLTDAAERAIHSVNEIRLPLHILLENHFGELNENQEEMLGAARNAAEVIDRDFEALQEVARLELGEITLRKDRMFPADIVNAILPSLKASAESAGISFTIDVAPLIPAITGDRVRLQRALLTLLTEQIIMQVPGVELRLSLAEDESGPNISLSPARALPHSVSVLLAQRTITGGGGSVEELHGALTIRLCSKTE